MSLRAFIWAQSTDQAKSPVDRLVLMRLADLAREEDHEEPARYRSHIFLTDLTSYAVTDAKTIQESLDALTERRAIRPVSPRSHEANGTVYELAVD